MRLLFYLLFFSFSAFGHHTMKNKSLTWIEKNCRFPTTAGAKLYGKPCGKYLLDFQKEVITNLFNADGSVNKPVCFLYGCRKVSKSLLFSWLAYHLISDEKRAGFQMPIVASNYYQGFIIFNFIKENVLLGKDANKFKIRKDSIEYEPTGNKVHVVFNSAEANFGGQASGAIFDEIGNYKDMGNMEAIETSMSLSEDKPIKLMASNPPKDREHPVMALLSEAEKDQDAFVRKFSLDIKKKWHDPQSWRINPFVDKYFKSKKKKFNNVFSFYKKEAGLAVKSKEKEISFRRLLLGQGVQVNHLEWIDPSSIKIADETVFGRKDVRWSVGIDLSLNRDFSALAYVGLSDSEELFVLPKLYIPNTEKRRIGQKNLFANWNQKQFITIQNTEVTNKQMIVDDFHAFVEKHSLKGKIESVVFDPALVGDWSENFEEYNPQKIPYRPRELTQSIRTLERIAQNNKFNLIGKNDCYLWMIKNSLVSIKSKNFCILDRASVWSSIDGPVATVLGAKFLLENKINGNEPFMVFPT